MSTSLAYNNVQIFRAVTNNTLEQAHRMFSGDQLAFTMFIEQLVTTVNIRSIFTPEGMQAITGESFLNNPVARNYILTIDSLFFANLADRHALRKGLEEILIEALCYNTVQVESERNKVLLSPEIVEVAATGSEIEEVFKYNRWIIPLLAILMWSKPIYELTQVRAGADVTYIATRVKG